MTEVTLVNAQLEGKSHKEMKIQTGQIYTAYCFSQWALDPTKTMKQKELNYDLQIFAKYMQCYQVFPGEKWEIIMPHLVILVSTLRQTVKALAS